MTYIRALMLVQFVLCGMAATTATAQVAHPVELSAVSPGRLVAGATLMCFGDGLGPGSEIIVVGPVLEGEEMGRTTRSRRRQRVLQANRNEAGTAASVQLPSDLDPGIYEVRVRAGVRAGRSVNIVVVPLAAERPGGESNDRELALPLVPGQTVIGHLDGGRTAGFLWDFATYYFVGAKGSTVSLSMERVDTSKPWEHPDSLDPELYIVGHDSFVPDNLACTDNRPGTDLNASIRQAVLPDTGLYLVVAGTTRGRGDYRLSFRRDSIGPAGENDRIVAIGGSHATVAVGTSNTMSGLALDPRGLPLAGALIDLTGGRDHGDGAAEFEAGTAVVTDQDGVFSFAVRATGIGIVGFSPRTVAALPAPLSLPGVTFVAEGFVGPRGFHESVANISTRPYGPAEGGGIRFLVSDLHRVAMEPRHGPVYSYR